MRELASKIHACALRLAKDMPRPFDIYIAPNTKVCVGAVTGGVWLECYSGNITRPQTHIQDGDVM